MNCCAFAVTVRIECECQMVGNCGQRGPKENFWSTLLKKELHSCITEREINLTPPEGRRLVSQPLSQTEIAQFRAATQPDTFDRGQRG